MAGVTEFDDYLAEFDRVFVVPTRSKGSEVLDTVLGRMKRDEALDLLEATRAELLAKAKLIAMEIYARQGQVTSPEVHRQMRLDYPELMSGVDPRFLGAVFRRGWRKIGYQQTGSHARPVAVWVIEA